MKQSILLTASARRPDVCAFTWRFYWASPEEATALA